MGFHQLPSTILFYDPIPKRNPLISPLIHQKMRKGFRNDYLEAFGEVYWEKIKKKKINCKKKKSKGVATTQG